MASDGGLFTVVGDMFSAVGKWIPSDPKVKPAYPEETQIDCFKNSMTCVEATADYYVAMEQGAGTRMAPSEELLVTIERNSRP
jgi:hypothetical protein